ncbi:MAG: SH3 domain-containing protein [Phenylobacterium sp.]
MNGQVEPSPSLSGVAVAGLLAAAFALSPPGAFALADGRPTPSGLPVPRYVTLKFGSVNARSGPGDDYPALWIYRVRGLPVQVIAESSEWRRICDPDRGVAWVHMRTTDGRRNVMRTAPGPLEVRSSPRDEARTEALLQSRALATLQRCEAGWCRIKADGVTGWVRASGIWGVDEGVQCVPPRPAAR